jgi:hypothetical protein
VSEIRAGLFRFNWSKAFADQSSPQVILSKADRSHAGKAQGVRWSAWVNLDGAVVPLAGLHMRAISMEYAVAIAVLVNVEAAVETLLRSAPARNLGTKEPMLAAMEKEWLIPDLSAGVYQNRLAELIDTFTIYRRTALMLNPSDAAASREYADVLRMGEALWQDR